jgi:phage tail tube protein FII
MYGKYFNCIINGHNFKGNAKSIDVELGIEYQDSKSPIFTQEFALEAIQPPKISIEFMYKDTFLEKSLGDKISIIALFATGTESKIHLPYIISSFGVISKFTPEKFNTTSHKITTTSITMIASYYKSTSITGSGLEIDCINNTFVNKSGEILQQNKDKIKL